MQVDACSVDLLRLCGSNELCRLTSSRPVIVGRCVLYFRPSRLRRALLRRVLDKRRLSIDVRSLPSRLRLRSHSRQRGWQPDWGSAVGQIEGRHRTRTLTRAQHVAGDRIRHAARACYIKHGFSSIKVELGARASWRCRFDQPAFLQ